ALDHLLVLAESTRVADADREAVPTLDRLRDDPAAEGDLDGILDVADADAVACRLHPVDLDLQIALAHDGLGDHILCAPDWLQDLLDLFAHLVNSLQVRAENLDADLGAHAGREHVDAVGNGLGPDVAPTGDLHHGIDFLHQVPFRTGLPSPEQEFLRERPF